MCRIASLFMLQRLKGSMSGDARDFNNIETPAVIKFSFLHGKAPKEIQAVPRETLREHAPSYATVKNWVAQFKRGDFTTPEIFGQIHELILEDHRISAKSIAEQLGISRDLYPLINGLSDHDVQLLILIKGQKREKECHTYIKRNINNYTTADFQLKLSNETWETVFDGNDVNKIFNSFLNIFLRI